ncbi:hypothetical protein AMK12_12650 [Streptomyces sp. TSRI0395]|nr:hypothetical protein AMK12_12650 [Streptomyces sp. TSRI0395]
MPRASTDRAPARATALPRKETAASSSSARVVVPSRKASTRRTSCSVSASSPAATSLGRPAPAALYVFITSVTRHLRSWPLLIAFCVEITARRAHPGTVGYRRNRESHEFPGSWCARGT